MAIPNLICRDLGAVQRPLGGPRLPQPPRLPAIPMAIPMGCPSLPVTSCSVLALASEVVSEVVSALTAAWGGSGSSGGCSWLLMADPRVLGLALNSWLLLGCSRLLLAGPGWSWLLMATRHCQRGLVSLGSPLRSTKRRASRIVRSCFSKPAARTIHRTHARAALQARGLGLCTRMATCGRSSLR